MKLETYLYDLAAWNKPARWSTDVVLTTEAFGPTLHFLMSGYGDGARREFGRRLMPGKNRTINAEIALQNIARTAEALACYA